MRSASSMSTATTRETPDSGMVTPISCSASSIVILLWLMNRNWVCADMRRTSSQNRSVFESSSGASTSSSRQKGAGLSWKSENTSAMAVRAFSPPESRWMLVLRFPGGCAMTCTPASRISSPVMMSFASPPPKRVGKSEPKCRFTLSKVSRRSSRVSRSIRRIASSSVVTASSRSADCESRKPLRSRLVRSSSTAARVTAPSSPMAWGIRVISPRRVQGDAHRGNRIGGELLRELQDFGIAALDLLIDDAHRVIDLGDLRAALALAEERVLRLALGLLHGASLLRERRLRADVLRAPPVQSFPGRADLGRDASRCAFAGGQRLPPPFGFGAEFGLFGVQLSAAFPVALLRLRELELLDLRVVPRLFLPADFLARFLERGFTRCAFALRLLERALRAFELSRQLGATPAERLDFSVAREQTGVGGIRRVQAHGVARELIAFPVHEHRPCMQGRAGRCIGPAVDDIYPGEPVPQRTADAVVECMDLGRQRQPAGRARRRRGGGLEEARLGRRALAEAAVH